MINKHDIPILRAFLHRESRMYRWDRTGESGRRKWVNKVCNNILNANPHDRGANYIRIHSITNMGCLDSELALTAKEFEPMKGDYIYNLPPSPTSLGGYHREPRS